MLASFCECTVSRLLVRCFQWQHNDLFSSYAFKSHSGVHPMDTVKVRLQLDNELSGKMNIFRDRYYKGIVRGAYRIAQEEGIRAVFQG